MYYFDRRFVHTSLHRSVKFKQLYLKLEYTLVGNSPTSPPHTHTNRHTYGYTQTHTLTPNPTLYYFNFIKNMQMLNKE